MAESQIEETRVFAHPALTGAEMMRAHFVRQVFSRHSHDCYAIGIIEEGAMGFRYLGGRHIASPGLVNLVVPGEVHDGQAAVPQGWRYRMFYLAPDLLCEAAHEAGATSLPHGLPHFRQGVINDPGLAERVRLLHMLAEGREATALELQTRLRGILARWISLHAEIHPPVGAPGREPRAVALSRALLDNRSPENVTLDELAREAGLSPFHLVRVFTASVGLPPHAYQQQRRLETARRMLRASRSRLADVAQECGFADQSHLTRVFKRAYGVTPGSYRKNVQN